MKTFEHYYKTLHVINKATSLIFVIITQKVIRLEWKISYFQRTELQSRHGEQKSGRLKLLDEETP